MDTSRVLSNYYPSDVMATGLWLLAIFCVCAVCIVASAVESKKKKVMKESQNRMPLGLDNEAEKLLKND